MLINANCYCYVLYLTNSSSIHVLSYISLILLFSVHTLIIASVWGSVCCRGNLRHEQVSSSVWQAATGCGCGLLVVTTAATQQTQDVEGQDQDDHAERCHTADPPAERAHKKAITFRYRLIPCTITLTSVTPIICLTPNATLNLTKS